MVTVDCPFCEGSAHVDEAGTAALICDGCGIRAELAPDPVHNTLDRVA